MKHPYLAKLLFLLLFAAFGFPSGAHAQTGSVSGRVTDGKNEGIPGATVLIEGTTLGSSSNVDGTFSIQNVPSGAKTLVISFVGYNTVRRPVTVVAGQNAEVAASLTENATALSEAVVVGYGTQRRQDITGAVATVDAKQFVPGQITNPEQLIQGKVAGVSITTGGGAPGAAATVRIRGNSSLNANNDPLYVIDGVPVDKGGINGASNPLSLINPNDIETFTVLKDASATAIYGNRASNGVILITTKRGLQGEKMRVELNSQVSVARAARRYDVLSAGEFDALIRANGAPGQIKTLDTLDTTPSTNWQDQIFRNAVTFDNNVSLLGSVGKVPFRVSYGNLNQQGIVITNKLVRNTGSVSLTPLLFDDRLSINVNAKGSVVDNRFVDNDVIRGAAFFDPTQPVRASESRFAPFGSYFQYLQPDGKPLSLAPRNPVAALNNTNNVSTVKRFIGNVQLDYKIHGIEGLRANLNLGLDVARGRGDTDTSPTDAGNFNPNFREPGLNGRYVQYAQDKDMQLLESYLAYTKQFGGDIKFDVQGGYSYQTFVDQGPNFLAYRSNRTTLFNPTDTLTVAGFYSKYVYVSFFGRSTLNIKDRYLVTATVRNDRSSRFASDRNSGVFPALGLAWRVKGEDFLKDNTTISELKIRAGYGITGQQEIGGAYDTQPRYITGNSAAQYLFGTDTLGVTSRPSGYNASLTWEKTATLNVGLDLGFFDNRLTATFDAYQRESTDLLAVVNVAAGANLTNQLPANIGSLRNRGVEAGLNYGLIRQADLTWDVNLNGAYNVNEITDLGPQLPSFEGYLVGGIPGGTGGTIQVQRVGSPSNAFLVRQQVYGPDGRPVQGLYVNREGGNYVYKQPAPLVTLGFSSNVVYKNLNLAFVLRGNIGNYIYNANDSNNANFLNAQGSTGYVTNLPSSISNSNFTGQQLLSDFYVQNGSFLRAENITLGYNVGKLFNDKATLRITGNVQNAFLITKYDGVDPEIFGGIDSNFYPRARTFTLGVNIGI